MSAKRVTPQDKIIRMGSVLVTIGTVLQPLSLSKARRVMKAVVVLNGWDKLRLVGKDRP